MKVLIIRNDHIGDMVYSTPIFRGIKEVFPKLEITVLASPANKPIIEKNPYVDKIIELDMPKKGLASVIQYAKMARMLRKEKFDFGIDLRGSTMNTFFLLWAAGVKKRISHIEYHPKIEPLLDIALEFDKKRHIFNDNAEILRAIGVLEHKYPWPEVYADAEDHKAVEKLIKDNGLDNFICICPIAGLKEKQWDIEKFRVLIDWIYETYPNMKIVLIGTSKDKEILNSLAVPDSVIVMDFNVRRLPLLLNNSKLVIAHDGGPMHSAWLTGSKVIALYPAEVADKFIPLKNCKTFISKSKLNMDSIKLEEVMSAVEETLQ